MIRRARPELLPWMLGAALLSVACATPSIEHEARITLRDPSGRLGAPPWKVGVLEATMAFNNGVEWVLKITGGEAGPDAPYVGRFATQEVLTVWGISRPAELELALVVPALARQDWWNTVILMDKDGTARGYARRNAFGSLHPRASAEILMIHGTAHPRGSGWSLELTIDVPPAPAHP